MMSPVTKWAISSFVTRVWPLTPPVGNGGEAKPDSVSDRVTFRE